MNPPVRFISLRLLSAASQVPKSSEATEVFFEKPPLQDKPHFIFTGQHTAKTI